MNNSVTKSIISEIAGTATEVGFEALASLAGFPMASLTLPFAKGLVLGLLENCYNDCAQKTLSIRETKKLNRVSTIALQTFRELAEKDGAVAWEMNIDPAYIDYSYEVAEHATMEAIRQNELAKVDILGRYYGKQFYEGTVDWQDMHHIITMTGTLSLRQIVLIRLISMDFKGIDTNLFVSNPSACVEINQLLDYGIWQTEGTSFGTNDSWAIQLRSIIPTVYSDDVSKALMLDHLSKEDIKRTIDSLRLTKEGTPQRELTEEDFNKRTTFKVVGEKLILPDGKSFGKKDDDEDMFLYDLARGK